MATSRESNGYIIYYVTASWVTYHKNYVMPSFPLCGVKVRYPPQKDQTRPSVAATAKKKKKNGVYPGCVSDFVSGMFYSAVATQPNVYIIIYIGEGGLFWVAWLKRDSTPHHTTHKGKNTSRKGADTKRKRVFGYAAVALSHVSAHRKTRTTHYFTRRTDRSDR